jgi:2-iminobutanoate/2-iminopropanoate deaminase
VKKEIVLIPGIKPSNLPFNQVVRAGDFLFLTSQLSCDLSTGEIKTGPIERQTRQTLENIKFILNSCHATMDDIVKVTIYLRNIKDFSAVNPIYASYFTPGCEPARVTLQAASPLEGVDIEIEVIAYP